MDFMRNNDGPCEFRCDQDANCLPSRSQVCDGHPDCIDHSDEAGCPQMAALVQTQPNPLARPYVDLMREISGVQICIVAVALVLTLGLITCVINHYKQFGARSWSRDQRRHKSSRKSKRSATTTTPSVLYSPAKADEQIRKETLLRQERQLRMLSVQRDFELNLPVHVSQPVREEEYYWPGQHKPKEIPKAYVRPPPNRTVTLNDRCVIPEIPPQTVHKPRTHPTNETATLHLVTCPSLPHPSSVSTQGFQNYVPERWQPPGGDVCTIHLFADTRDLASNYPPPKYEDCVSQGR